MSAISDALDRLQAAKYTLFEGELSTPLPAKVVLRELISATERLRLSVQTTSERPSASSLDEAKKAWESSHRRIENLTTRAIRALCWDPASAMDPAFAGGLAHHPDLSRNRRWLEGLIESYKAQWRIMPDPLLVEKMLFSAVKNFTGRSYGIQKSREVADHLFSSSAAAWLGQEIRTARGRVDETLARWRIEPSSGLGTAAANAAVDQWTSHFERDAPSLASDLIHEQFCQLTQELLSCELVTARTAAHAMSALILSEVTWRDDRVKEELISFLLNSSRFGDPRLPARQHNWALVNAEAKQRAIGWMAKGDLLFFFEFIITNDPHGRREFWLKYIERAVDAHVALSSDDALRLRQRVKERPTHSEVLGGQGASAFLMRFKGQHDVICVEFSQSGNALFIHDTKAFLEANGSIRSPQFALAAQLKNAETKRERFVHATGWQWKVRQYLAQCGIRPIA